MSTDKTESKKDLVIDFDPKSGSDADFDFINLLSSDKQKSERGPLQVAAVDAPVLDLISANEAQESAWQKALKEFPGQAGVNDDQDPHAYPRELAQRETLGTQPLSNQERNELETWRQFPGLDDGSDTARNLRFKELFDQTGNLTLPEAAFLRSWEEFPNPDPRLDNARTLRAKQGREEEELTAQEKNELEAWRSFSNPDPQYDRPRELTAKSARKDLLTKEESAELSGWMEFPGLDQNSASLRKLVEKEYLHGEKEGGLNPSQVAKLEAWRAFDNPDSSLNHARQLAQIHILANYGEGPELSETAKAELTAWQSFSNPDQKFNEARELAAKAELSTLSKVEDKKLSQAHEANNTFKAEPHGSLRAYYRYTHAPERGERPEHEPRRKLPRYTLAV
ncbi:MAG: hypothetical protein K2W82_07820 [Candidatus Obscuribacterales bacterium]|nr:hypothetical protein [Candidatus Obscuribacterales bacterium]